MQYFYFSFTGLSYTCWNIEKKIYKRFIKELSGKNDSKYRIGGTVVSSIYLMMQGVQILRIHDVNEVMQGIKVFNQIIKN